MKAAAADKRVRRSHRRDGHVSADVLDAQHSLHRLRARAAGPLRGGEAGGAGDGHATSATRTREMQMLEGFHLYPLMIDLRFHRWDDDPRGASARARAAASPRVLAVRASDGARPRKGRCTKRRRGQRSSRRERRAVAAGVTVPDQQQSRRRAGACCGDARRAARLAARARRRSRSTTWRRAVDARVGDPVRRAAGLALSGPAAARRRAACAADRRRRRRRCSARRSRSVRATAGCCSACGRRLLAQKRDSEATLVEQQFNAAWKDATVKLRIDDL